MDARRVRASVLPMPWATMVRRVGIEERLEQALQRSLTTLVAGAGFGKTTLLESWTTDRARAWHTVTSADGALATFARSLLGTLRPRVPGLSVPAAASGGIGQGSGQAGPDPGSAEALASQLAELLDRLLRRHLLLVLDDFHELGREGPSVDLVEALVRQAPRLLHVVIAGRDPLPFRIARMRATGDVLEFGPEDLALTPPEVRVLLSDQVEGDLAVLGDEIHRHTGGWPAAVRLAAEALQRSGGIDWGQRGPSAMDWREVFELLAEEVIERERPGVLQLLRATAPLDRFTPELCADLGLVDAAESITDMTRRGLYLERRPATGELALTPLIRDFLLERFPLEPDERVAVLLAAAGWHAAGGRLAEALRLELQAGRPQQVAARLAGCGLSLAEAGSAELVLEAIRFLSPTTADSHLHLVEGAARMAVGDMTGAIAALNRIVASGRPVPAAAWRLGLIHHLRGDLVEADRAYSRGETGDDVDTALLWGWRAALLWLQGDVGGSGALAREALSRAEATGDGRSLACAHTVLAMVAAFESDRAGNEFHYLRALEWAERSGDVLQMVRIRVNRGSHHLEEGYYLEALEELDLGLALADLGGFSSFRALGLSNRGSALLALGRLEEAISSFEAARSLFEAAGSRLVAYPLSGMADINRIRGERVLAESRYEEAIEAARAAGDMQGLVPPLCGLAQQVAAEDLDRAGVLVEQALAAGPVLGQVAALVAAGWVALVGDDRVSALALAAQGCGVAGARRDRAGLAEALELRAMLEPDSVPLLVEARSIWRDLGNPIAAARTDLSLAYAEHLSEDTIRTRREVLLEFGARWDLERAERHRVGEAKAVLSIGTLGGLQVRRAGGEVVASGEWQSKKARDLLKILVARRGKPVPRDQLIELLWPDDDPARSANRLSVALATLRRVLDPEGEVIDRMIAADRSAVCLRLEAVSVDVENFLREAAAGLADLAAERRRQGLDRIRRAAALYAGDFLEEDLYEDWAVDLREEARRMFIQVARVLAAEAVHRGEHETATRHLLLILERDPYDERAHLALVGSMIAAGSHGEARRLYRRYVERLAELDIEPAPYPRSTRGTGAG
jgi:DNA-binding SARP family transcriptional activator